MTSILESSYNNPNRPYSQNELNNMRLFLYNNIRLGKKMANHQKCGHVYLTKHNGRKEKEMYQQNSDDVGKCSVCWKISKTPKHLQDKARNLSKEYCNTFKQNPTYITYQKVDLESSYYNWLYNEFN
jgi:hypothetical protein